jgi:hypothetical protein
MLSAWRLAPRYPATEQVMPTDLSQLVADFYDYFLGLYHQKGQSGSTQQPTGSSNPSTSQPGTGSTPVRAFLAFENIGTPMTPEMFQLKSGEYDAGLVQQQFSLRANSIPVLDGINIAAPGLLSVDAAYAGMLNAARPLTAADVDAFGQIVRSAKEEFDNAASNYSIPGLNSEFHPAIPTPPDWPLPTADAAWTSHSFQQSSSVTVTAPTPPRVPGPVPRRPLPVWGWRVAPPELSDAVKSTGATVAVVPPRPSTPPAQILRSSPPIFHPMLLSALAARESLSAPVVVRPPAPPGPLPRAATLAAPVLHLGTPAAAPHPAPPASPGIAPATIGIQAHPALLRSDLLALHFQELRERSTPQAVTSSSIKLSFEYCLVEANRAWLSGSFLTARNWYVPHTKAGEIASGTGTGGGSFEVLPVAALVVRNLTIEADWSHDDIAVQQRLDKFGPFSLIGRSIDAATNALLCKEMQVVAWVFEPMPCLPPNSDPAM